KSQEERPGVYSWSDSHRRCPGDTPEAYTTIPRCGGQRFLPACTRKMGRRRTAMPPVYYQNERLVEEDDATLTLLQVSHKHGLPHASACGGQARCSTCRVLVIDHAENLTPHTQAEALRAGRRGFGACIRLACQARPLGPITIRRLVLDDDDREMAERDGPRAAGEERTLAILFSDIRGFTSFAESHLAYDVVHILNRYFRYMGDAVLRHGGYIDKYLGDGLMALFRLGPADADASRRAAVACALDMGAALPELN